MSMAMLPTPPVAPVTTMGPRAGAWPLRSMRWIASAAVKPAVPSAMARNASRPGGMAITLSRFDARELRITAVDGFGQAAAGDQHRIAGLVARIRWTTHHAREIDAADQRIAPQDLARAGRRQRVLVVDAGVLNFDDDFAGR